MVNDRDIHDREKAAVDACDGVPTEALQPGCMKELLAAIRQCYQRHGVPETETCRSVASRLRQLDSLQGILVPADYPGDPSPEPSHTHWRLLAAWLPLPIGAVFSLGGYLVGIYDPVQHDGMKPEHMAGWLMASSLTGLAGVLLTVRGLKRLKSESDGAFVWRALAFQWVVFIGTMWLCMAVERRL